MKVLVTGVVMVVTKERAGTQNRWCGIPFKRGYQYKSFLVYYTIVMLLVRLFHKDLLFGLVPHFQ